MGDRIHFDYSNMMSPRLGARGVDPARLSALAPTLDAVLADAVRRREGGGLGFYRLPYEDETVRQIREFAEGPGQAFENVVVLGIGGSALGTTALREALLPPRWNELDDEARQYYPRLYVLDNVDPATIGPLL